MSLKRKEHVLVVAIDFGTAYSGYAFQFKHDFDKDPTNISACQAWNGRKPNLMSSKTPTCLLLDKDRNIDSFGFEAEDKYANLCLERVNKKYYFFRRFKLKLQEGEAGILSDNLDIALEPEAASLCCQYLPIDKFCTQKGQVHFDATPTGTKYMVLDLGGGTADITVHEELAGGKGKEIVTANRGPWGGTALDAAFFKLITDIVDKLVMTAFQGKNITTLISSENLIC